jgi:hypothetical protein
MQPPTRDKEALAGIAVILPLTYVALLWRFIVSSDTHAAY